MLVPEGLDHALEWVKAAIGAVKQPKRDWKQLAADPQTAGELLLTWAAGRSSRGVAGDAPDAQRALLPHLQQLAVDQTGSDLPKPLFLDAPSRESGLWPGHTVATRNRG